MRLTKEEFLNGVQKLQQMYEEEHIIIDVLDISPDWVCGQWLWNYYTLLNKMCDLPVIKVIGTDLDWFCWETEFGKHNNVITVDIEDGENYKAYVIETAEDLWNYWDKETDYLRD